MVNRFALAGCLAKENLGIHVSDSDQQRSLSASSIQDILLLFYTIIENEEMEKDILGEIEHWYNIIVNYTDEQLVIEFGKTYKIVTGVM